MIKKLLLAAGCLVLLVMCGLLVVFLKGETDPEEEEARDEPLPLPVLATPPPAPEPEVASTSSAVSTPPPLAPARPHNPSLMVLPPVLNTMPAPATPVVAPVIRAQPVARSPVLTPIQQEISKMQKLATSGTSTGQIKDRTRRLADALAEARRSGRWPQERIRRAELELKELQAKLNLQGQNGARLQQAAKNRADRERERAKFVGDIPEKDEESDRPPR